MKASDIPDECLRDPQFVKVLTASLCSQIAESKRILANTDSEIQELKDKVEQGLEQRKVLKQTNKDLKQKKAVQLAALESLEREAKNRSTDLETVKNGLADATLRQLAERAKYEKILDDYRVTWGEYKAAYEEFPLAKEREKSRITVRKLEIELMTIEYKKNELIKMLKLRKAIDAMRIRAAGVDISEMVLQRWKDEKYLEHLRAVGEELRTELGAYDRELSRLRDEDEKTKIAEIETSKMPPPRLDFSFMRSAYSAGTKIHKGRRNETRFPRRDSDTTSVNTLMLEEMCKEVTNENTLDDEIIEKSNSPPQEKAQDIPLSVLMTQESGPPELVNPTDKSALEVESSISVFEFNIENKLRNLGIENSTKGKPPVHYNETPEYNNDDNNMEEDNNNEYEDGTEESFRRTRRWCEESRKELAPYLLGDRRAQSAVKERRLVVESSDEVFETARGRSVQRALSAHGSETRITNAPSEASLVSCSRAEDSFYKNNTKEERDRFENSAQQTSRWDENLQETPIQSSRLGKRKHPEQQTPDVDANSILTTNEEFCDGGQEQSNENNAQVSPGCEDNLETSINRNLIGGPKIMNIEKINHPLGQRPRQPISSNSNFFTNLATPCKKYAPSCTSTDNFSNAIENAFLTATPQGSYITEMEETPNYQQLFSARQNLSPQGAESVVSFVSTIADQQVNAGSLMNQNRPNKEKSPIAPMNFGGFFGTQKQDQKRMF